MSFREEISSELSRAADEFRLGSAAARILLFSPLVLGLAYAVLLTIPGTRALAVGMGEENHVIEWATFFALLLGGVLAIRLARRAHVAGEPARVVVFFALFALGMLITAMEEIAWGQGVLRFETPDFLRGVNRQGEVTLHNLEGVHGKMEFARLAFGLAGLLGIYLARFEALRAIAAPRLLALWFLAIAVHGVVDIWIEFSPIQQSFDRLISHLAELIEMFIGISGLAYAWLLLRRAPQGSRRN